MHLFPDTKHRFWQAVSFPMTLVSIVTVNLAIGPVLAAPYELGVVEMEDLEDSRPALAESDAVYSPYVGRAFPDQVFFGDTHFHTNLSFDAGLVGTTLDVDAGFRFARGEKVISNTGQPVQLIRPLDFLVVRDHAEFIGLAPLIHESHPELLVDTSGNWVH